MAGNWEKCYSRKRKPDGNYWTCYKKKGHHLDKNSKDRRRHVDNKQAPAHYWDWDYACDSPGCTEPPDPYMNPEPEAECYCDLHRIEVNEKRAALARKGIY